MNHVFMGLFSWNTATSLSEAPGDVFASKTAWDINWRFKPHAEALRDFCDVLYA